MSDVKSGLCELQIRVLPLESPQSPVNAGAEAFDAFLRNASLQLFGRVSGLIDFEVVEIFGDKVTLRADRNDLTKLWSALTLYAPPHTLYSVVRTKVS